jgi:tetratricopeptide (TPR) repeat protein
MPYLVLLLPLLLLLASCASTPVSTSRSDDVVIEIPSSSQARQSDEMYQVLLGELAGKTGDLETATQAYVSVASESSDPAVAERATRIALFARDYPSALEAAKYWEVLAPNSLDAKQIIAVLYARFGETEKAIAYFETIILATRDVHGGGFEHVSTLLSQDVPKQNALIVMRTIADRSPDDYRAEYAFASLANRFGAYGDALAAAEAGLALNAEYRPLRLLRDQVWLQMGNTDKALDDVAALIRDEPEDLETRLAYAQMLVEVKRYDQARLQFEYIIERQPGNADLLYTLGLLNVEIQHYDDAILYLTRVLETGKHVMDASYYLGRIAERREEYQEAASWYLRVSEGEYRLEAQTRIAIMLAKLGYLPRAREQFSLLRQELESPEQRIKLYLTEYLVLEDLGKYEQAMHLLNRGLDDYPGHTDILYSRAMLSEKMDRVDLMERDLLLILDKDPSNVAALNALGYTLADRTDRYAEALVYIQQALKAQPDDPAILDSMGWVQYRLGNLEEAEHYLRRAHSLIEDDEIASHLSELIWARGQQEEALKILNQALEKFPDSQYLKGLKKRIKE